jgi:hypothetical protein
MTKMLNILEVHLVFQLFTIVITKVLRRREVVSEDLVENMLMVKQHYFGIKA